MATATFQIRKAERHKAKLRLALSGPSGSGKTYSALLIAQGLGGKIGMVDTERGSGELYAHVGDYDIIALDPPYTVSRYIEAIQTFERANYDIIIIDSITHEWAGEGGLLRAKEQLDAKGQGNNYNPFASWAKITPHHDRFISAMLSSPCHIIATMRSKTTYVQEGSSIKKRGVEPVQRDQIEYEFTVVLDINTEHTAHASKDRTELFGGWMEQITPQVGGRLLNWLNNVSPLPSRDKNAEIEDAEVVGEARPENVAQAGQPDAVGSDDAHGQAPASPVVDEADGKPGVRMDDVGDQHGSDAQASRGGKTSSTPDAPADASQIAMVAKHFNGTVERLKKAGRKHQEAFATAMAEVTKFTPLGIPGLRQDQIEACAEALQGL